MSSDTEIYEYFRKMHVAYGEQAHDAVVAWAVKNAGDVQMKNIVELAESVRRLVQGGMSEAYQAGSDAVTCRLARSQLERSA